MDYNIKNIATVNQIADITGYTGTNVRLAIQDGRVNMVYAFPDNPKDRETGQQFIVCDNLLAEFLISAIPNARRKFDKKSYHPLIVAKKRFEFLG